MDVQIHSQRGASWHAIGAVLWSSDIPASWQSLQVQVRAGLSTMMCTTGLKRDLESSPNRADFLNRPFG